MPVRREREVVCLGVYVVGTQSGGRAVVDWVGSEAPLSSSLFPRGRACSL